MFRILKTQPAPTELSIKQRDMLVAYHADAVRYKPNHAGYWYSSISDKVVRERPAPIDTIGVRDVASSEPPTPNRVLSKRQI